MGKADQSKHTLGKRENNFHIKPALNQLEIIQTGNNSELKSH